MTDVDGLLDDLVERSILQRVEPTAIRPDRVLVLTEREQEIIAQLLANTAEDVGARRALYGRIAYGDEYADPVDELARTTLRKRVLESEIRRANKRIEDLKTYVVEDLTEQGVSSVKHAATGATLRITRKVWAKVCRSGEKVSDEEKAAAARGLVDAGLGDYVQPGFNTNTISAHFRELIKEHDAIQQSLPEDRRRPMAASDFLPPELLGLIELTDDPDISVTASRS